MQKYFPAALWSAHVPFFVPWPFILTGLFSSLFIRFTLPVWPSVCSLFWLFCCFPYLSQRILNIWTQFLDSGSCSWSEFALLFVLVCCSGQLNPEDHFALCLCINHPICLIHFVVFTWSAQNPNFKHIFYLLFLLFLVTIRKNMVCWWGKFFLFISLFAVLDPAKKELKKGRQIIIWYIP